MAGRPASATGWSMSGSQAGSAQAKRTRGPRSVARRVSERGAGGRGRALRSGPSQRRRLRRRAPVRTTASPPGRRRSAARPSPAANAPDERWGWLQDGQSATAIVHEPRIEATYPSRNAGDRVAAGAGATPTRHPASAPRTSSRAARIAGNRNGAPGGARGFTARQAPDGRQGTVGRCTRSARAILRPRGPQVLITRPPPYASRPAAPVRPAAAACPRWARARRRPARGRAGPPVTRGARPRPARAEPAARPPRPAAAVPRRARDGARPAPPGGLAPPARRASVAGAVAGAATLPPRSPRPR